MATRKSTTFMSATDNDDQFGADAEDNSFLLDLPSENGYSFNNSLEDSLLLLGGGLNGGDYGTKNGDRSSLSISGTSTTLNSGGDDDKSHWTLTSSNSDVWTPGVVFRVATISFLMVLTLVGNVLLIAVIAGQPSLRRKRVSVFLVNLAVGDLMVCFVTMTTEILFVAFGEWVLGAVACKLVVYGQVVTLASTTFLLTAMSIDRYQVLVHPLRSSSYGGARSVWRKLVLSWLLALIFAAPQLFIFVQVAENADVRTNETLPSTITTGISASLVAGAASISRRPSEALAVSGATEAATGRAGLACKSSGYTAEWQRKTYMLFMTVYILVIPTAMMVVCYAGIIRVVWLRTASSASVQQSGTGTSGCVATKDRPKLHFVSSRKGAAAAESKVVDESAADHERHGYSDNHHMIQQQQQQQQHLRVGAVGSHGRSAPPSPGYLRQSGGGGSFQIGFSPTSAARLQAAASSKRNVVKMTMSVIVGFVACWTPYFVVSLVRVYSDYEIRLDEALSVSELMAMAHSALNPLLYMLFSRRALTSYCGRFRRWWTCCCGHSCASRRHNHQAATALWPSCYLFSNPFNCFRRHHTRSGSSKCAGGVNGNHRVEVVIGGAKLAVANDGLADRTAPGSAGGTTGSVRSRMPASVHHSGNADQYADSAAVRHLAPAQVAHLRRNLSAERWSPVSAATPFGVDVVSRRRWRQSDEDEGSLSVSGGNGALSYGTGFCGSSIGRRPCSAPCFHLSTSAGSLAAHSPFIVGRMASATAGSGNNVANTATKWPCMLMLPIGGSRKTTVSGSAASTSSMMTPSCRTAVYQMSSAARYS